MAHTLDEFTVSRVSSVPAARGRVAEITAVPTADARHILNPFNTGIAAGLTVLPVLVGTFSVLGG
ncbi:MAG: hypothetical protein ACM3U2_12205, partial [Deltaproteobacteria bacterium]